MRNGDVSVVVCFSNCTTHLQSAALLRSINHASRAQGKLPLRSSGFHSPVEHASAISALPVFHLPKGGRYWWIDQSRSARAHTPDHQGERKHLVRIEFPLSFVLANGLYVSFSPHVCNVVVEDRIYKAVLNRDTPEETRALSERHFCSKCSAMLWLWDEAWCVTRSLTVNDSF